MELQSSFRGLSLISSVETSSSSLYPCHDGDYFKQEYALDRKHKETVKQDGSPYALVHSDYPYRICETSDSFADILGFKPKELQGGSLRLLFGPETDLQKLKKIVSDQCQDDNDRLVLYRRDGDEIACSIHSTASDLRSGERVSTISILNYTSAQRFPLATTTMKHQSAARDDEQLIKSGMRPFPSTDVMMSFEHDPALLIHLSTIRRSRTAGRGAA
jgi:PAS domain S-box-containing protein